MKKRKYYYICECVNGVFRMTTYQYAEDHWDAEKMAEDQYFERFDNYPVDVKSWKSTKKECDNIFNLEYS